MLKNLRDWQVALFVFVVSLVLLLLRITVMPLFDWDEAIYAKVARELGNSEGCLTLTNGGILWFHKPPLQFWLTHLAFQVTSNLELAARVVSVVSGAGVVTLSYLFGAKLRGSLAGAVSAIAIITTVHFVDISRDGMLDALLSFWILLSMYMSLLARERPWFWILVGVAAGAAIMTKGAAGLVAPLAVFLYALVLPERWAILKSKWFWGGVGSLLLVAMPWHIAMYQMYGETFMNEYVRYHVLSRAQEGIEGHAGSWVDYARTIHVGAFPWSLLYPFVTAYLIFQSIRRKGERVLAVVWVPLLVIALLYGFVVQSKLSQYIIPLYPLAAIAGGVTYADLFTWQKSSWWKGALVFAGMLLVLPGAYVTGQSYRSHGLEDAGSVKELRGARLMGATIDSNAPLVIIAGIKWWPSAQFYSGYRSPIFRPTADELAKLVEDSSTGVDILLGKGESFTQPEGVATVLGESEDFQFIHVQSVDD